MVSLVTLNLGRGFPDLEDSLRFLETRRPDIACLQDVRESYIPRISKIFQGGYHFVGMSKHLFSGVREQVGLGVWSLEAPFIATSASSYVGHITPVLNLDGVTTDEEDNSSPRDLARVRETESRLVVSAEAVFGGLPYRFSTTHGIWTPTGVPDAHQERGIRRLTHLLQENGDSVIAGDFNVPRNGSMYRILMEGGLVDHVPWSVTNSIDWGKRGKKGPDVLVDYVFTLGTSYEVSSVETHFDVSDHAAITAVVQKHE